MSVTTWKRVVIASLSAPLLVTFGGGCDVNAQKRPAAAVSPVASIGVESGDPRKVFGHIPAVAVDDARGVVFVADRLNSRLSAFTRGGQFITAAGRTGSGPGEFRSIGGIASNGSTVYVLDHLLQRISTYALRNGSLVHVDDTRMPFSARDLCALGNQVFLLGYHNRRMVHRFDRAKGRITSFGAPFQRGDEIMAAFTADGHIACDQASNSVYLTAVSTPTVRRYSPQGKLLWQRTIPDIAPSVITRKGHGVTFSTPPNRENPDAVVSLAVVPGNRVLVQFGETWRGIGSLEEVVDVQTVLFDARSGAVLRGPSRLPRIDFTSGKHAYSHASDPFPRVVVYTWR